MSANQPSRRDLAPREIDHVMLGECPFCGGHDLLVIARGGMSTNRGCANEDCGAVFNMATFNQRVILAELVKEPKAPA